VGDQSSGGKKGKGGRRLPSFSFRVEGGRPGSEVRGERAGVDGQREKGTEGLSKGGYCTGSGGLPLKGAVFA